MIASIPPARSGESSLGSAFRAQARRLPAHPAVSDGGSVLTYRELDEASDRVAAALLAGGAPRGAPVGLITDRSAMASAFLVGIVKAGCAYVPLDPAYPADRLRYIADDSGIEIIVGNPAVVRASGLGHLTVTDVGDGDGRPPPDVAIMADDPAYVIYTSGSTGRPKGCVVTHENVLSLLWHTLPLFDVGESDRWALFHSMSFDFSVWELWGALLSGGTAVCVPGPIARAPDEMLELLVRERVTVLNQVPSAFRAFARLHAAIGGENLALRYVVFGGESIDMDVAADFVQRLGPAAPVIVNMYGITEATVHTTIKVLSDDDLARRSGSPIGRPLPHAEISIRDDALRPVPDGEVGEMLIAGDGVASGYLNRPELTAERFVTLDSPTGPRRYYRSGDLARRTMSGELEYLGRNDQQVKIRGFRIELGEIEAVLREHDEVNDAAVLAQQTGSRRVLVACVVPANPGQAAGLDARLRQHLGGQLPQHMLPARFRFEERLPLTPSGKLDRRALEGRLPDGSPHNTVLGVPVPEISFRPLTPVIGADVKGVDLAVALQPAVVARLRDALLRHKVLVFRDQPMNDARQVALTAAFGGATAAHPIANGLPDAPAVLRTVLSEDRPGLAESEVGNPLGGAVPRRLRTEWHIDITFVANPTAITILRGVQIPPTGGDTLFANLEALYGGLSPSLRGYLDTLKVVHSRHNPSPSPRSDGRPSGPFIALHPLVRVHPETGARSLVVSSVFMQGIRGLKPRESTALLDFLLDELAGRDEIHARVRWDQDTLVMWDNRAVAHAGPVDGLMFEEERIVHRTTVVGDLLRGPDGFVSRALKGGLFEALA